MKLRADLVTRDSLKKYVNNPTYFAATFDRFGSRLNKNGLPRVTMCFRDVIDEHGELITDHVWFSTVKGFYSHDLQPGDRVQFQARAFPYEKGSVTDYKLGSPSHVKRLPEGDYLPCRPEPLAGKSGEAGDVGEKPIRE